MQPRRHCARSNRSMNSDELPTQGMDIMSIQVPSNPQDSKTAYAASAVPAGFSFTSRRRGHGVALVQLAATCFVEAVTLGSRHPDFVVSSVHRLGLGSHWLTPCTREIMFACTVTLRGDAGEVLPFPDASPRMLSCTLLLLHRHLPKHKHYQPHEPLHYSGGGYRVPWTCKAKTANVNTISNASENCCALHLHSRHLAHHRCQLLQRRGSRRATKQLWPSLWCSRVSASQSIVYKGAVSKSKGC